MIKLDPSSLWAYETKHTALHKAGDYENAITAFGVMLLKMEQSPDPGIRREFILMITAKTMICSCHPLGRREQYKTPSKIRARIRRIVKETIRDSPYILINTSTGKSHGRDQRESVFESLPTCQELISSMTTCFSRVLASSV